MADVQYVVNIIVYEDGHRDVIFDSSVALEDCYNHLLQVTVDMEAALGNRTPPTPPKHSPKITRLK